MGLLIAFAAIVSFGLGLDAVALICLVLLAIRGLLL